MYVRLWSNIEKDNHLFHMSKFEKKKINYPNVSRILWGLHMAV